MDSESKYMKKKGVILLAVLGLAVIGFAETWRLGSNQDWQPVNEQGDSAFVSAATQAKQFVSTGKAVKAKKAFSDLKKQFPELAGDDFDAYVKAELLYANRKFSDAAKAYDNFIEQFPQSPLRQSAMERQYQIATAFLNGQKRPVLKVFKLYAYEEGSEIMNKIVDRAGNSPIAKRALETLAQTREKRGAYDEAYLAWSDAANRWPTGDIGKESLMGMARSLEKDYRGPNFDGKVLISSKSYYSEYIKRYPESAQPLKLNEKLNELDEKIAQKELAIAAYYNRTGSYTAANLYYQRIIDEWPASSATKTAEQKLPEIKKELERQTQLQSAKKKKINWKGLLL
jgi:outer membrane protein assembly factor BamD (BamD/ComL family)